MIATNPTHFLLINYALLSSSGNKLSENLYFNSYCHGCGVRPIIIAVQ